MGLFSKAIADGEWLEIVIPLYQSTLAATKALNDAILVDSIAAEAHAVSDALYALQNLSSVAKTIKSLGSPTSSEARKAKKKLESALSRYIDGSKGAVMFLKNLTGGAGKRLGEGGMSARAAAGSIVFSRELFHNIVKDGEKSLQEVSAYFNIQPKWKGVKK